MATQSLTWHSHGTFNTGRSYPYELSPKVFDQTVDDILNVTTDIDKFLLRKGLPTLVESVGPATYSSLLSDMLTRSLVKFSRSLVINKYHNGHPDLLLRGAYAQDEVKAGEHGVEIKATRKKGGGVDTHGARNEWLCVFVYAMAKNIQEKTTKVTVQEIYLAKVDEADFRVNERGIRGTRTAALHKDGLMKLRDGWVFLNSSI